MDQIEATSEITATVISEVPPQRTTATMLTTTLRKNTCDSLPPSTLRYLARIIDRSIPGLRRVSKQCDFDRTMLTNFLLWWKTTGTPLRSGKSSSSVCWRGQSLERFRRSHFKTPSQSARQRRHSWHCPFSCSSHPLGGSSSVGSGNKAQTLKVEQVHPPQPGLRQQNPPDNRPRRRSRRPSPRLRPQRHRLLWRRQPDHHRTRAIRREPGLSQRFTPAADRVRGLPTVPALVQLSTP